VIPSDPEIKNDANQLKQYRLSMVGINDDEEFGKFVENYKRYLPLFNDKNEV
jgi:hypothetical protein